MLQRVAITGAAGRLGAHLVVAYRAAGHTVLGLSRPQFDLTRAEDLERLGQWQPHVVVNAAAWTDVDGCARDPERATRVNGHAAGAIALASARVGARMIQISTNEVFDGRAAEAYSEQDEPRPGNAYGQSKLLGERLVESSSVRCLIIRTAWLFGPSGPSFVTKVRDAADRAARQGRPLRVVDDEWGNPTWIPVLAEHIVTHGGRAMDLDVSVLHLAGTPPTTRFRWARAILGEEADLEPVQLSDYARDSVVPPRAVLATALAQRLGIGPNSWLPHARGVMRESAPGVPNAD